MSEDLKPSPAALERMARAWCIEHYDGGPPTHGDPVEPFRQALAALAQHDQATPGVEPVEEVLITPPNLQDLIGAAFEAGCQAVHDNYQPDPDPSFSEAAWDYVASLDFTETTRPSRSTAQPGEVERLRSALEPFAAVVGDVSEDATSDDTEAVAQIAARFRALDAVCFFKARAALTPSESQEAGNV